MRGLFFFLGPFMLETREMVYLAPTKGFSQSSSEETAGDICHFR